ncbi:hypothetical protein TNCV_3004451 [Trichonephila clavipes]|nr:hypothetical protein TNCV_3004451 [Trichonephila clavipes]
MIGQMVLIKEDFLPINTWPLVRILEVYHGNFFAKARFSHLSEECPTLSVRMSSLEMYGEVKILDLPLVLITVSLDKLLLYLFGTPLSLGFHLF